MVGSAKADVCTSPAPKSPTRRDGAESPRNMRVQPLIGAYSPLRGNRRLTQFVEQRLGLFEVGGVQAFGEPGVDRGEQGESLLRPALLPAQTGETHRTAQFPGLRVLSARDLDGLLQGGLGLARRPGASEQGLALEP